MFVTYDAARKGVAATQPNHVNEKKTSALRENEQLLWSSLGTQLKKLDKRFTRRYCKADCLCSCHLISFHQVENLHAWDVAFCQHCSTRILVW